MGIYPNPIILRQKLYIFHAKNGNSVETFFLRMHTPTKTFVLLLQLPGRSYKMAGPMIVRVLISANKSATPETH